MTCCQSSIGMHFTCYTSIQIHQSYLILHFTCYFYWSSINTKKRNNKHITFRDLTACLVGDSEGMSLNIGFSIFGWLLTTIIAWLISTHYQTSPSQHVTLFRLRFARFASTWPAQAAHMRCREAQKESPSRGGRGWSPWEVASDELRQGIRSWYPYGGGEELPGVVWP